MLLPHAGHARRVTPGHTQSVQGQTPPWSWEALLEARWLQVTSCPLSGPHEQWGFAQF